MAVERLYLCPECQGHELWFNVCMGACDAAVCPACIAHYFTFQSLFRATAEAMGWGEGAWDRWLAAHPDYIGAS